MSQQTYPWPCEYCGTVHHVSSEHVGTKLMCQCFNLVTIPELNVVRATVPEHEMSPVMAFDEAIRLGQLPSETNCVVCGQPTTDSATMRVECRGSKARAAATATVEIGMIVMFHWIGLLFGRVAAQALIDKDGNNRRSFALPVRACDGCRPQLLELKAAVPALKKTPLYVRLLSDNQVVRFVDVDGTPFNHPATPDHTPTRRARRIAIGWVIGLASTPLANFALILIIASLPGMKDVFKQGMEWIIGGSMILGVVIGTLIGWAFGQWHRRRWPETVDPW